MKVPIFDLQYDEDFILEFQQHARSILEKGFLGEGVHTQQFENKFANFVNAWHGIAVSSGTAALEIALKAVGVAGREVIMPSNTFFATAVAVRNAGAQVKLVDIERETFSINPKDLEEAITPNTGAVIVVHIGGIISEYIDKIKNICDGYNVPLIEDAAHAHGSRKHSWCAGSIGDLACFSFFPTKVMTTGEGGMITTNDEFLARKCRSLKNFGRKISDAGLCVNGFGNNYKVHEFTSLLGSMEMDRVEDRLQRRKELAEVYHEELKDSNIRTVRDNGSSYYKMITRIYTHGPNYHEACKEAGITLTGKVYDIPVHRQPVWRKEFKDQKFHNTEEFTRTHICPPLYPELSVEQVKYVCKILKEAYEKYYSTPS